MRLAVAREHDHPAVGTPVVLDGGIELPRRDLARMAAVAARGDDGRQPALLVADAHEGQPPAVGGERRVGVAAAARPVCVRVARDAPQLRAVGAQMIQTPLSVGLMSRSNAIQRPSGENTGWPWKPLGVSSRNPLPSRRTTAMLARSANPRHQGESPAVGRPRGLRGVAVDARHPGGAPAAVRTDGEQLPVVAASCAYAIAPLRPGLVAAAGAAAVASAGQDRRGDGGARGMPRPRLGWGGMVPPMQLRPILGGAATLRGTGRLPARTRRYRRHSAPPPRSTAASSADAHRADRDVRGVRRGQPVVRLAPSLLQRLEHLQRLEPVDEVSGALEVVRSEARRWVRLHLVALRLVHPRSVRDLGELDDDCIPRHVLERLTTSLPMLGSRRSRASGWSAAWRVLGTWTVGAGSSSGRSKLPMRRSLSAAPPGSTRCSDRCPSSPSS